MFSFIRVTLVIGSLHSNRTLVKTPTFPVLLLSSPNFLVNSNFKSGTVCLRASLLIQAYVCEFPVERGKSESPIALKLLMYLPKYLTYLLHRAASTASRRDSFTSIEMCHGDPN